MSPRHPDVELSESAYGRPIEEVYRAVVGNDKGPSFSRYNVRVKAFSFWIRLGLFRIRGASQYPLEWIWLVPGGKSACYKWPPYVRPSTQLTESECGRGLWSSPRPFKSVDDKNERLWRGTAFILWHWFALHNKTIIRQSIWFCCCIINKVKI